MILMAQEVMLISQSINNSTWQKYVNQWGKCTNIGESNGQDKWANQMMNFQWTVFSGIYFWTQASAGEEGILFVSQTKVRQH